MEIEMNVLKRFKDPLSRQANEGIRIANRKPEELLNSKSEFHQPSVVRLQVEKKTPKCGPAQPWIQK